MHSVPRVRRAPRRRFAVATAAILLALLAPALWPANATAQTHPRLLFTSSDLPDIQSHKSDLLYDGPYNDILIDCRSSYGPGRAIPSYRRRAGQGLRSHGALLLIDPSLAATDTYQSDTLFHTYFDTVLNYSEWGTLFGGDALDTGYLLCDLALGFDWHYDRFSLTQKNSIIALLAARADAMVSHDMLAIDPDLYDPTWGYLHRFKVLRNKFVIAMSGLGMTAYCLEGHVDESRRQTWLNKVNACLQAWNDFASPDGVSLESYSYHEFMMQPFVAMLEARTRATGVNQFEYYSYVANHPIASMYSWIPGGWDHHTCALTLPFGDSSSAAPADMRTVAAIFSKRSGAEWKRALANWQSYGGPYVYSNNSYARDDSLHYFYTDDDTEPLSPTELNLPNYHYFPDAGVFVWRSGWDTMATYFAMIAGHQFGGHQHPEMGNFIIYKGGAPYIAHHQYTYNRRSSHHNVLMVNDLGQEGEDYYSGTTQPQPDSKDATIEQVIGHSEYFNVYADLDPCYRVSLYDYKREYLGLGDFFFVRDVVIANSSSTFELLLHAYRTTPPDAPVPPVTNGYLDIDSNPTANPWAATADGYTITPRTTGPITESMLVKDLSKATSWNISTSPDIVSYLTGEDAQRGYKMSLTNTASSAIALTACYFPDEDETLEPWPTASAEGFVISDGSGTRALGAWSFASGSVPESNGLALTGAMGGVELREDWFWGRDLSAMTYGGNVRVNATAPVTLFAAVGDDAENEVRVLCTSDVTVTLHHPDNVSYVLLNDVAFHDYSWADGLLTLSLSAQPSGANVRIGVGAPPTPTPSPTPLPTPDPDLAEEMIVDFYEEILARTPGQGEIDAWVLGYFNYAISFNIDVRFVPREMGRLFFLSAEYEARNTTDAEFISDCYQSFLGRFPSKDELTGWLGGTWDRAEVVTIFAESDEFGDAIAAKFPGYTGNPTRNFVTRMYIGLLDRLVDQGGLEYAASLFEQAADKRAQAKQMAREILQSDEFLAKSPATSDYVDRLYRAFLGRFPNAFDERPYWVGELEAGRVTTDQMIDAFGDSQEFTDTLTEYFGAF